MMCATPAKGMANRMNVPLASMSVWGVQLGGCAPSCVCAGAFMRQLSSKSRRYAASPPSGGRSAMT